MITATVEILEETSSSATENGYTLCFQYCATITAMEQSKKAIALFGGRPDGSLQAARGQARIPSLSVLLELTSKALADGWGNHNHALQKQEADEIESEK